jgi:ABC-type uncharacterized transport system permease subunit
MSSSPLRASHRRSTWSAIRKHVAFSGLELRQMAEFKPDFYLFWLESLTKAVIMTVFWWQMWERSAEATAFSDISRDMFMTLLLGTQVLQLPFRGSERIPQMLEDPVVTGRMALVLCRPVHPIWMNLFRVLCQQGRLLILALCLWMGVHTVLLPWMGAQSSFQWEEALPFVLSIGLGMLINFFLYSALGALSFWVGYVWSLLYVISIFSAFLSGQYFPLHVDAELEFWSRCLPFRYIAYSPMLIGTGMEADRELLRQFVVCVMLGGLTFAIYRRGLRRFEAAGG